MQVRSTPIFWLLLTATLLVDSFAIPGLFVDDHGTRRVIVLYLSLAYAQLSLLCVWIFAGRGPARFRWLALIAVAIIVSLQLAWVSGYPSRQFRLETVATMFCLISLHVAPTVAMLWFVIPASWVSRHRAPGKRRKQYSTLSLLILMTGTAVFLSLVRAADWFAGEWADVATFCLANFILLVGILALLQTRGPALLRFAACVALAIGISAATSWTGLALSDDLNPWVFFILQGSVIAAWLVVCLPNSASSDSNAESLLPAGAA